VTCGNCEVLRARVHRLERELGLRRRDGAVAALIVRLGVTQMGALILLTLYEAKGRFVQKEHILETTLCANAASLRVQIKHIRAKLAPDTIITAAGQWRFPGAGYALSPAGRAAVLAALQPPEIQDERG